MDTLILGMSALIPVLMVCGPAFYFCIRKPKNLVIVFFILCVPILAFLLPIAIPLIASGLDRLIPGVHVPHDIGLVALGLFVSPFVAVGSIVIGFVFACVIEFSDRSNE